MNAVLWQTDDGRWQVLTDNGSSVAATRESENAAAERARELGYRVVGVVLGLNWKGHGREEQCDD